MIVTITPSEFLCGPIERTGRTFTLSIAGTASPCVAALHANCTMAALAASSVERIRVGDSRTMVALHDRRPAISEGAHRHLRLDPGGPQVRSLREELGETRQRRGTRRDDVTDSGFEKSERFDRGLALRKEVLGREHVERSLARAEEDPFLLPIQQLAVEFGWGEVWSRPGLPRKTRSFLSIAYLAAEGEDRRARGARRGGGAKRRDPGGDSGRYCSRPPSTVECRPGSRRSGSRSARSTSWTTPAAARGRGGIETEGGRVMSTVNRGGKSIYGASVGVLMLETRFPRIPGDVGNAGHVALSGPVSNRA